MGASHRSAANFQLVDSAHPAVPGETVLIYCTGLGAVSSPPADGAAANGQSTVVMAKVTMGGVNAAVSFSGLAVISAGLFRDCVNSLTLLST